MLTIVLHGHGATTIRLAVSIVGIVLAGLGTLIILAQRVMFVLDGSGNLGALTSRDGEAESALVREVDITEGKVFVDHRSLDKSTSAPPDTTKDGDEL